MVQSGSVTRNMLPVQQTLWPAHPHHLRSRPPHPNLARSCHFANAYRREARSTVTREWRACGLVSCLSCLAASAGTVRDVRYYGVAAASALTSPRVPVRYRQGLHGGSGPDPNIHAWFLITRTHGSAAGR